MARTGGDDLGEDFATTPIDDESEEYNRKRKERTENPEDQISKEKKHKKRVQVAESENERSSDEAVASGLMKLFRKQLRGAVSEGPILRGSEIILLRSSDEGYNEEKSDVELARFISESLQTTNTTSPPPAFNKDRKKGSKNRSSLSTTMIGCPRCVVISMSALRCCALVQKLRENGAPTPVAKLFSKHMKISDQKKLLATTAFDIVIGTPNRLAKLLSGIDTDASKKEDVLENGSALSLSNCELLVIDATYKDAKKFSILSLKDVTNDLAILFMEHVLPARRINEKGALSTTAGKQMKVLFA